MDARPVRFLLSPVALCLTARKNTALRGRRFEARLRPRFVFLPRKPRSACKEALKPDLCPGRVWSGPRARGNRCVNAGATPGVVGAQGLKARGAAPRDSLSKIMALSEHPLPTFLRPSAGATAGLLTLTNRAFSDQLLLSADSSSCLRLQPVCGKNACKNSSDAAPALRRPPEKGSPNRPDNAATTV